MAKCEQCAFEGPTFTLLASMEWMAYGMPYQQELCSECLGAFPGGLPPDTVPAAHVHNATGGNDGAASTMRRPPRPLPYRVGGSAAGVREALNAMLGQRVRYHASGTAPSRFYRIEPLGEAVEVPWSLDVRGTVTGWEAKVGLTGETSATVTIAGYGAVPADAIELEGGGGV